MVKVEVVEDRVVDENGRHVGTVMSKSLGKMWIYCFLCEKVVSGLKHYEEEHAPMDYILEAKKEVKGFE